MKFFSRLSATVAIAAAALLSIPFGASAQSILNASETVPNYSYVGIGGGNNGFVVNGKLAVADHVSIRPEISTDFDFNDSEDVSYLVPVTYDFNTVALGEQGFNPFVGAGIAGDIGDNSDIDFALVAGTDYRFAQKYVANASVNYSPFADNDEVGFTAGIGYLF